MTSVQLETSAHFYFGHKIEPFNEQLRSEIWSMRELNFVPFCKFTCQNKVYRYIRQNTSSAGGLTKTKKILNVATNVIILSTVAQSLLIS